MDADPERVSEIKSWFAAIQRPEIRKEIADIHREIADAIRSLKPLCLASGNCCRFEAHGHRLYASGLEVARCVEICRAEGRGITSEQVEAAVERGNCPWQEGRLCTAREGRPTGCRVYFCDPRASEVVPELAETAHRRIRTLHDEHEIPYAYGEWREMLRQVIGSDPGRRDETG
ncbi:MAG: hypothetical protein CMJ23_10030 [Phycisphaerae bacterium]|nr:hypothetical protein [Phycisphaerae bacterium]